MSDFSGGTLLYSHGKSVMRLDYTIPANGTTGHCYMMREAHEQLSHRSGTACHSTYGVVIQPGFSFGTASLRLTDDAVCKGVFFYDVGLGVVGCSPSARLVKKDRP